MLLDIDMTIFLDSLLHCSQKVCCRPKGDGETAAVQIRGTVKVKLTLVVLSS
jgi:hypothetical protein